MKISNHVRTFDLDLGDAGFASLCNSKTLTRRRFAAGSAAVVAAAGLGVTALPVRALAAKKTPQKLVKYQATPKNGRKCAGCTFFQASDKSCKVVEGTVDPNGWCLRWAKKKA